MAVLRAGRALEPLLSNREKVLVTEQLKYWNERVGA